MRKSVFIIISLILILGCSPTYVKIDNQKIKVEIADNPLKRQKGLMHRESLCKDCGMLFVFNKEKNHTFWMKNTLIPLDMIFINKDKYVIDIVQAQPCKKEPCKIYFAKNKSLYVLETNQGRFNKNIIGQIVTIK